MISILKLLDKTRGHRDHDISADKNFVGNSIGWLRSHHRQGILAHATPNESLCLQHTEAPGPLCRKKTVKMHPSIGIRLGFRQFAGIERRSSGIVDRFGREFSAQGNEKKCCKKDSYAAYGQVDPLVCPPLTVNCPTTGDPSTNRIMVNWRAFFCSRSSPMNTLPKFGITRM